MQLNADESRRGPMLMSQRALVQPISKEHGINIPAKVVERFNSFCRLQLTRLPMEAFQQL